MYKSSTDRRFRKNKKAIRSAYMSLVQEKGYQKVTISDIAERADINRMTFYAHYDIVEDIFAEFIDEMETHLLERLSDNRDFNLDYLFNLLNELMYEEVDFFRYVAKDGNCSDFRAAFVKTIEKVLTFTSDNKSQSSGLRQKVIGSLLSSVIAYAYLDWLAEDFGDASLDEIITITKELIKDHMENISFRS